MKKPIVIGNWKMYVEKPEVAKKFVSTLKRKVQLLSRVEVVLVPPFTLVPTVFGLVGKSASIRLGAQTLSPYPEPAHTGYVSSSLLKVFGVSSVLVGHSERRYPALGGGESEDVVRAQIVAAHAANLTVVLCVGEVERDTHGGHFAIIERQLQTALAAKSKGKISIAYEPVWAIGKSAAEAMAPSDVREMVIFIRKTLVEVLGRISALSVPILYGGSVEGSNAAELLQEGGVSGFLVGHASANIDSFIEILTACQ